MTDTFIQFKMVRNTPIQMFDCFSTLQCMAVIPLILNVCELQDRVKVMDFSLAYSFEYYSMITQAPTGHSNAWLTYLQVTS